MDSSPNVQRGLPVPDWGWTPQQFLDCWIIPTLSFTVLVWMRVQDEEKMLCDFSPEYVSYIKRTGRFFPKLNCQDKKGSLTPVYKNQSDTREVVRLKTVCARWVANCIYLLAQIMTHPSRHKQQSLNKMRDTYGQPFMKIQSTTSRHHNITQHDIKRFLIRGDQRLSF